MTLSYATENAARGYLELLFGESALAERIAEAWDNGPGMIPIDQVRPHSSGAASLLTELTAIFSRVQDSELGWAKASVSVLSRAEIKVVAYKIVDIHDLLSKANDAKNNGARP